MADSSSSAATRSGSAVGGSGRAPSFAVNSKTGSQCRVPILKEGAKDVTGRAGAPVVDAKATYADLQRADGNCARCGKVKVAFAPSAAFWNSRLHWAACCPWDLTEEDQENQSMRERMTSRVAKIDADAATGRVAAGQTSLSFPPAPAPAAVSRQQIKRALQLYCASSTQPFGIVEAPEFKHLLRTLNVKGSDIPVRRTISTGVLHVKSLLMKEMERQITDAIKHDGDFNRNGTITLLDGTVLPVRTQSVRAMFSITLDGWSSRSMKPFLGVTLHFLTRTFDMRKLAVAFDAFEPPHTAARIIDAVKRSLARLGFTTEHIVGFTTDNGSNMLAAADEIDILNFRCSCHTIHLSVLVAIESAVGKELLDPVWAIVVAFAKAPSRLRALKAAFVKEGKAPLRLIQRVPTRWGSFRDALQRAVDIHDVLRTIPAAELDKDADWQRTWTSNMEKMDANISLLRDLLSILDICMEATRTLEAEDQVTVSHVLPTWDTLLERIEKRTLAGAGMANKVQSFAMVLLTDLKTRYHKLAPPDHGRTKYLKAARLLDPTTGYCLRLNPPRASDAPPAAPKPKRGAPLDPASAEYIEIVGFLNTIGALLAVETELTDYFSAADMAMWENRRYVDNDILKFKAQLAKSKADGETLSCLEWWKKYSHIFPDLAFVAQSVFSVMASSAPAERLFSRAALVFTDRRNNLGEAGEAQVLTSAAAKSGMDLGKLLDDDDASTAASESAAKRQKLGGDGAGAGASSSSRSGEGAAPTALPAPDDDKLLPDDDDDDDDGEDDEDSACFTLDVSATTTLGAALKDPVAMNIPGTAPAPLR